MANEQAKKWWQEDLGCGWVLAVLIVCMTISECVEKVWGKP